MSKNGKAKPSPASIAVAQSLIQEAFAANRAVLDVVEKLRGLSEDAPLQAAAWRQVYDALWRGVQTMNEHAVSRPDAFRFGAEACFWPVIKSPGQGFQDGQVSAEEIFRRLNVGENVEFRVAGSKWRPNDSVGEYAVELWHRVYNGRLIKIGHEEDAILEDRQKADGFRKLRAALPQFVDAWEKWWDLAEVVFDREWNGPARDKLVRLVTAESKKASPGRQNAHLKLMLKERFKSMAGANKVSRSKD